MASWRSFIGHWPPSIAPERLLQATLLMILFSVRSERQLMERMHYDLLFAGFHPSDEDLSPGTRVPPRTRLSPGPEFVAWRWTTGVGRDGVHQERERLIAGAVSQRLLESFWSRRGSMTC